MKGIDLFCASQASTAIRIGTDEISPSSSTTSSSSSAPAITLLGGGEDGGGRAIDRHNPIIRDGARRIGKSLTPCISQQSPINPRPYNQLQKGRKKSSKLTKEKLILDNEKQKQKQTKKKKEEVEDEKKVSRELGDVMLGKASVKAAGKFISPPTSSRYLLDDDSGLFDDGALDFNSIPALLPPEKNIVKPDAELSAPKPPSSSSSSTTSSSSSPSRAPEQVVVLRVSLHCRGCVGKLKKHLSRMQGVTSFNIDFAAKKVTLVGDVTPAGMVESIAKVMKNAQLWTPTMAPTVAAGPTFMDVNK